GFDVLLRVVSRRKRTLIRANTATTCTPRALVHAMLGLSAFRLLDHLNPAAVLLFLGFLDHVGLRAAVHVAARSFLHLMAHLHLSSLSNPGLTDARSSP